METPHRKALDWKTFMLWGDSVTHCGELCCFVVRLQKYLMNFTWLFFSFFFKCELFNRQPEIQTENSKNRLCYKGNTHPKAEWNIGLLHIMEDLGKQTLNNSQRLYGNQTVGVQSVVIYCSWKVGPGTSLLYVNSLKHCTVVAAFHTRSCNHFHFNLFLHISPTSIILVAEQGIRISAK